MPKCKLCTTVYRGMNHTVYECETKQAENAGPSEFAKYMLQCAEEGRVILGDSVRLAYQEQIANV